MKDFESVLDASIAQAKIDFADASNSVILENIKARYLGKHGCVASWMKTLSELSKLEKKTFGASVNRAKQEIETSLHNARKKLLEKELLSQLAAEELDVTLPGRISNYSFAHGGLHPVMRTMERVEDFFAKVGFDIADGPEIENDWYSFTALNNPPNHPARSMQDTFYLDIKDENGVFYNLRPHTSPMQVRYVQQAIKHRVSSVDVSFQEMRVIAPGRTYRVDADATHSPMFHQCEGLWLGANVSFKDLKVLFFDFCRYFFESDDLSLRFRPSFFPFTEPSAEIDIMFNSGSMAGKWLEVAGSGQVHPNVLENMGLERQENIGFAFGIGLDRLTMLRYGVEDLRDFFEGDLRFLSQFR